MDEILLVKPSKELESQIWDYRREYLDSGETGINGSCGLARYHDFDAWLDNVFSRERGSQPNGVPASTFFSVRKADNRIIGSIQLRHSLTPELEAYGGHIGYGVRPAERGRGYGKAQLTLVLGIARGMGIPWVLITCDKDNIPSGKTAISCGGVLTREYMHQGIEQQAYRIDL